MLRWLYVRLSATSSTVSMSAQTPAPTQATRVSSIAAVTVGEHRSQRIGRRRASIPASGGGLPALPSASSFFPSSLSPSPSPSPSCSPPLPSPPPLFPSPSLSPFPFSMHSLHFPSTNIKPNSQSSSSHLRPCFPRQVCTFPSGEPQQTRTATPAHLSSSGFNGAPLWLPLEMPPCPHPPEAPGYAAPSQPAPAWPWQRGWP
mmetsp:Transcript_364/g.1127  ORF Transcript_364/g.1127 Transcript_364/m.1127 type:complete len:202 (-) Transcript_364:1186-1791(-)